jgi:hypothetical protein
MTDKFNKHKLNANIYTINAAIIAKRLAFEDCGGVPFIKTNRTG